MMSPTLQNLIRRVFRRWTTTGTHAIGLHRGKLYAPYFIFLRYADRYSDANLLNQFGLTTYRRMDSLLRTGPYAILATDGEWTQFADDWSYTLWHMASTRPALASLAHKFDVFAGSVGECDRSFDFVYYHDSRLIRKYGVEDPEFRGAVVVEEAGEPLPGESSAFKQTDESEIVLAIANSLGIKTEYTAEQCRIYAPP